MTNVDRSFPYTRLKTIADIRPSGVDKHTIEGETEVVLCNYVDVYKNDRIDSAIPFMRASATASEIERFTLQAGDVLITKDSETPDDIAVAALVDASAADVLCGYHLALLRPKVAIRGIYLFWALKTPEALTQFSVRAQGITRFGLTTWSMGEVLVPCPSLDEQSAIASFLDRETGKIDALVAEQERLIALLKEKRQALISQAVTKGLDPNVKMKDSGVEWLGKVPAHWKVSPIGCLCRELSYGFTNPMPVADDGPFMLTANDVGDRRVNYETARRTTFEAFHNDLTDKSRPRAGDILITKDGTLGRVAIFDNVDACINQSVASLRLQDRRLADFLASALADGVYQRRMIYEAGGTTIKHIYISRLAKMPIAVPPIEEALQVAGFCSSSFMKAAEAERDMRSAISLLQERRAALISAAVTGKIDVRDYADAEQAVA